MSTIDCHTAVPQALLSAYPDVYTDQVLHMLNAVAPFDEERRALMQARLDRRISRARARTRITFPDPDTHIGGTQLTVRNAREGAFAGAEIPHDLKRQWIQGTGPAAKPRASLEQSLRNVAYALLSGADGWMFDGEDALGQTTT